MRATPASASAARASAARPVDRPRPRGVVLRVLRAVLHRPDHLAAAGPDEDRQPAPARQPVRVRLARPLAANWNELFAFQTASSAIWLGNSVLYSFVGARSSRCRQHPGRLRARPHRVPAPPAAARHDAHRDAHPEHRAGAADLPRAQRRAPDRQPARRHPAVLVLPVRGVPDVHLLLDGGLARPARTPPASTARASCGSSRSVAMPLATPVIALVGFFSFVGNWNNYFLPFVMVRRTTRSRCRSGLRTCSRTCRLFNPTTRPASSSSCRRWRSRRCSRWRPSSSSSCSPSDSSSRDDRRRHQGLIRVSSPWREARSQS